LFSRKGFCALGLGLEIGLELGVMLGIELSEIRLNTFWLNVRQASVLDPFATHSAKTTLIRHI